MGAKAMTICTTFIISSFMYSQAATKPEDFSPSISAAIPTTIT